MTRRLATLLLLLLAVGCASPPEQSLAADGVIGCAEVAAWGRIESVTPDDGRLRVTLRPERWLTAQPAGPTVEFRADDPAVEANAPAWRVGDEGLLILSAAAPPALYPADAGADLEDAWRKAVARRPSDCP
ncbi:hypothetical protein [Asanoa siamensis]|uniref:Lipoprotein n=1 Tax=Asanoa siamensis TaxID=926357 RepID=A0ABQ4D4L5_9ACTN|nr:hypothetical protein [Asanoa siamensis]GIF78445.1 hypothetical protein Asi02nite_79630 [Asanoa siamensis]